MKRPLVLAALLTLALAGWMASGLLRADKTDGSATTAPAEDAETDATRVQVRTMTAEPVTRRIVIEGEAEPHRTVTVRAETSGRAVELPVEKGTRVAEGELLARLAMKDRRARLEEAKALVAQRESEYQAAQQLEARGFQSKNRRKEAEAALAAARARLAAIREEIADTTIEAPFGGMLAERPVEMGQLVSSGGEVARIIDSTPLEVVIHVPQQKIRSVEVGTPVEVAFITGDSAQGVVSFVAASANSQTRTYRVEVQVPNDDNAFRAGMSAEVRVPIGTERAHRISPAILSLNTAGELGVKTVTGEDTVAFNPVEIVRAETDGAWVVGLPEEARVITVGQGFVRDGERVEVVPADSPDAVPSDGAVPVPPAARGLGSDPQG
ncbi:membrane fusion protein, multidrug efflux system [Limimonas halophila]|uniref:Membrane fusion protein, multidrug efflux system n=1 Tax=Limimonas halophila TaxID=1082479 RepID=A0A1G7KYP1_9PROT|nr:efflux RND transporter periplasmic adaptor subunit [Limimonas halophila]SDF42377.1 membrane fusion protein, multidrug efflux system [Limimonas halophila]